MPIMPCAIAAGSWVLPWKMKKLILIVRQLMKTSTSPGSAWRDVKVYKDHAFVVADGAEAHGIQIFDLRQLRDVEPEDMPVTFEETARYDGVNWADDTPPPTAIAPFFNGVFVDPDVGVVSCGGNGQIWWRQDGIVFRARLGGPLGIGTIFINGDHRELTVTDGDGQVTELNDAELDLRQMYGWTIPVTSLRYWALGIPDPSAPAETEIDENGRLIALQQRNWQVEITQYKEHSGQLLLGAVGLGARDGTPGGNVPVGSAGCGDVDELGVIPRAEPD